MSIREYMIAPFSSANSEVFTLICCGLILFIVMVLTFMVVVVTVKNTKRHNQVVRNLKIYMTEHSSEANLINEYESVSSRMREIFVEIVHPKSSEYVRFSTIVDIFRKVGGN